MVLFSTARRGQRHASVTCWNLKINCEYKIAPIP